jgi:hypothetical protein
MKRKEPIVITYPLWALIVRSTVPIALFLAMQYHDPKGIRAGDVIFVMVWFLLFYLIGQYRYARIEIFEDGLRQVFVSSFYLKDRQYQYNEIEAFFFRLRVAPMADPYMRIDFKNGTRKTIRMNASNLVVIRSTLLEAGLPVYNAK